MESWLAFRLYFPGIIAGSAAQILLALVILFASRKVYALSFRSSEENESELCESVEGRGHTGESVELLPRTPQGSEETLLEDGRDYS